VWRLLRERRVRQEAEGPEAVVDRDYDEIAARQFHTVVERYGHGPFAKSAAIDENEDRKSSGSRACRRPQIQIQAVFADRTVMHEFGGPRQAVGSDDLHAARRVDQGLSNARPGNRWLRFAPPQRPDGWRRVGDSPIHGHGPGGIGRCAVQAAGLRRNDRRLSQVRGHHQENCRERRRGLQHVRSSLFFLVCGIPELLSELPQEVVPALLVAPAEVTVRNARMHEGHEGGFAPLREGHRDRRFLSQGGS